MINSRFSIYFGVNMIVPSNNLGNVFSAFQKNEAPDHASIAQAEDELMQAEEHPHEAQKLMQQVNQSLQYPETTDKAAWHLASRIKRAEARPLDQPDYLPGLCVERTFISALKTLSRQASAETDEVKLFRENIQALCARIEAVKADPAKLSPFPSLPRELLAYICALANLKHTGVCKDIDRGIVQWVIELINTQHLDLVQDLGFTSLEQIIGFFGDQFSTIKNLSIMGLKKIFINDAAIDEKKSEYFSTFINSLKNLKSFALIKESETPISFHLKGDLVKFASNNPDLEELAIGCQYLENSENINGLELFTKMKSLELIGLSGLGFTKICSLKNLKTIENLTIENIYFFELYLGPLSQLQNLKKLNLLINGNINYKILCEKFSLLKNCHLEELNLFNFRIPHGIINTITTLFHNLKKIKLYNCDVISFEPIKEITIEELSFYQCIFHYGQLDLFSVSYSPLDKLKKVECIGCKKLYSTPEQLVEHVVMRHQHQNNVTLLCDAAPWALEAQCYEVPLKKKFYERKCAHLKPVTQAKS
jgi:hypothetical protein